MAVDDISLPGLVHIGLDSLCSGVELFQLAMTSDVEGHAIEHLKKFENITCLHLIAYR